MSVIPQETPKGHTPHSDCWCYPTIAQYQDGDGRWHTRIVHELTQLQEEPR